MSTEIFDWLERDTDEAIRWQEAQDQETTRFFAQSQTVGPVRALLESLSARSGSAPWHCGERWFSAADDGQRLVVAGADGTTATLFDSSSNPDQRLRDFWPSPDGRLVVAAVLHGPAEAGDLVLIDTATGDRVGSPALFTTWTRVAWLPDSSAAFFNGVAFEGDSLRGAIYEWVPGNEPVQAPVISPELGIYAKPSNDGRRVLVSVGNHALRPVAFVDRTSSEWQTISMDESIHFDGSIVGDDVIAITTLDAPRGRIVRCRLGEAGDPARWTGIVPESENSLRALEVVDGHIVVSELADGCGQLRVVDLDTCQQSLVPVPIRGAITSAVAAAPIVGMPMCRVAGGHPELSFLASGPALAPTPYAYDLESQQLQSLGDEVPLSDAVVAETVRATSSDGTQVPCVLVHRTRLDRTRPQPTLVLPYGGFNLPNTPRYQPAAAAFVMSGGIVAYPMVRGGGEFGDAWWNAGRGRAKHNTFDDLYAVCETLIANDITSASQLALQGGSNGGLTAAAAAAHRPDLFAAVVATAPLTDLLRHHLAAKAEASTAVSVAEFGDPTDPEDAAAIATWSPCTTIVESADPPAVFVATGEQDVRTPAWHARKFVAAMQAQRPGGTALLRIWRNFGHGVGGGSTTDRTAEWLTFVMDNVGLEPASRA